MRDLLFLDTETSSLEPRTGALLEVACARWSVTHRSLVEARSWIVRSATNDAAEVNGIPVALVAEHERAEPRHVSDAFVLDMGRDAECIVAHHAAFDRQWFGPNVQKLPWLCTLEDVTWPRPTHSKQLSAIALAHGVGVVSAHRALADVMTLVQLFERVAERTDIAELVQLGLRPRKRYAAVVSYEKRDLAKNAGFAWDGASKQWTKRLVPDDAAKLPFPVREVAA